MGETALVCYIERTNTVTSAHFSIGVLSIAVIFWFCDSSIYLMALDLVQKSLHFLSMARCTNLGNLIGHVNNYKSLCHSSYHTCLKSPYGVGGEAAHTMGLCIRHKWPPPPREWYPALHNRAG